MDNAGDILTDRGLVSFSVAGLGKVSVVGAATLILAVHASNPPTGTDTLQLYAIAPGETWGKGFVSWNLRNSGSSTPCAGGPGLGAPGGSSYGALPLDSLVGTTSTSGAVSLTVPGELAQQWINDGATNVGVLVRSLGETTGNRIFFHTRENGTVANRLLLSFNVELPEPATTAVILTGGVLLAFRRGGATRSHAQR